MNTAATNEAAILQVKIEEFIKENKLLLLKKQNN